MLNTPHELRLTLIKLIHNMKENPKEYIRNPEQDFIRVRKLPFDKLILSLLSLEGSSLTNELLRQSGCSVDTVTAAAFVQQRAKLLPKALEDLFHAFVNETTTDCLFKGYRLLAVDGSDIQIPTNKDDLDSLYQCGEAKPYNVLHLNALYDLLQHTYEDAIVLKGHLSNENRALTDMVDRCTISVPTLITADRGYEAYNNMTHIQEKGW